MVLVHGPAGLARDAWQRRITTFETTATGRLFDAASSLILNRSLASFEGQGPMELEAIAAPGSDPLRLPLVCDQNGILRSDWGPLLPVISDHGLEPAERAGIFHQSMAQALVDQALELARNRRFPAWRPTDMFTEVSSSTRATKPMSSTNPIGPK